MRLLAEILRSPSFPAAEFEQLRQQTLTSIERQRSEPATVALNAVQRHINIHSRGHVNYYPTFDEQTADYKAVTLEQAKAFHRDFYGASNGQLTIVGDFDPKAIATLAAELFGSWESRTRYVRIASEYRDFAAIDRALETPDKANAFFLAYQPLRLHDEDPDYPALLMAANALAGDPYKNRIMDRLRQKEGISYAAGGGLSAGTLDPVGSFHALATFAPQFADQLLAAFKEEVARALKDGLTVEELEGARQAALQSWRAERSMDGQLASHLNTLLFYDRTLAWDATFEDRVKALTLDEVNRALRKFIDADRMIIVKAGDFANAKQAAGLRKK
jgi:zinc protease